MHRGRPGWQDEGRDPDYRFSMANERTFLAWVRTALALLAASVAVAQLLPSFRIAGARTLLGVLLAVIGTSVAFFAYAHWSATEQAMRADRPPRYSAVLPMLSTGLGLIGLLVLLFVATGRR